MLEFENEEENIENEKKKKNEEEKKIKQLEEEKEKIKDEYCILDENGQIINNKKEDEWELLEK